MSALNVPCEVILYSGGRQNKKREPEKVHKRGEESKLDELRRGAPGNFKNADSGNLMNKRVMDVNSRGFITF